MNYFCAPSTSNFAKPAALGEKWRIMEVDFKILLRHPNGENATFCLNLSWNSSYDIYDVHDIGQILIKSCDIYDISGANLNFGWIWIWISFEFEYLNLVGFGFEFEFQLDFNFNLNFSWIWNLNLNISWTP